MKYINQIEPLITENEVKAMMEYLQGDGWLTEFKKTEEFEQMIADFLGVKYCVVATSGTGALYLALLAAGIGKGGEVIVPDYTMIATPNAVKWAEAEVRLCDVDKNNLCLDLNGKIDYEVLKFNIKAMICVSINGRSGNMDEVVKFCANNDLILIEDACQAFGSKWNDKYLGTFGDVGVFSFSPHKIITTGQGGAIVTDNKEIYEKVKKLKDFHRTKPGVDVHDGIGYNFKFTDLQAVIGLEQLKEINYRINRKGEIYGAYLAGLLGVEFIEMLPTDLDQTVPWFVDILLKDVYREDFISYLEQNGIGSREFYPRIHYQDPYADYNQVLDEFGGIIKHNAQVDFSHKGVWLPSSINLSMDDIKYICEVIKKFPHEEIHGRK